MKQLLTALIYLHSSSIIHRDLKPENIMIQKNEDTNQVDSIKIIDFGFATIFDKGKEFKDAGGTPNYVAPEVFLGKYDERSDIFSLGCILYYM